MAFAWLRVGVTVIELVEFVTDAEYVVVADAKEGDNVPELNERFDKVDKRIDGLEVTVNHRLDEVGSRLTSVERRATLLEPN